MSTPTDQLIVSRKAMAIPTFAGIVAMQSATFPVAGTVQNYDYDVGHDGIIGIKTGSDTAAKGCWSFAATRTVAGSKQIVYGVVMGIPADATGLVEPALSAGTALADAAARFGAVHDRGPGRHGGGACHGAMAFTAGSRDHDPTRERPRGQGHRRCPSTSTSWIPRDERWTRINTWAPSQPLGWTARQARTLVAGSGRVRPHARVEVDPSLNLTFAEEKSVPGTIVTAMAERRPVDPGDPAFGPTGS